MNETKLSIDGQTVSATPANASAVSAVLRKAGHTKSVTTRAPGVKFPVPSPGFHVQNWTGYVRVSSTFSGTPVERYEPALTAAGYVVEREDFGRCLRVYKAAN